MRWFAVLAVSALAAAAAGVLASGGTSGPAAPVLPDLDQAAPSAISVVRRDGRYALAFGSAVDNVGRGALEIRGRRAAGARAMDATQLVRLSDGSVRRRPLGRIIRYERAETHSHWHLHRFARYELRRAKDGKLAARAIKQGFCLGDRYDTDRRRRVPGEPALARWTHECGRGRPALRRLDEGISPGYGDDYAPYLEGQHFALRGLPAGRYVLVHRVNPHGVLREARTDNNAASLLLELRRPARGAPAVVVIRRCPGSTRCPR